MKAIQFSSYGGPETLQLVDAPEPHAGPGQIRIAVRCVGVNPAEWKVRAGLMRDFRPLVLPAGLGVEASGVVDEIGADVTGIEIGEPVFGLGASTYAEYALLNAWTRKPEAMSFAEAAATSVAAETAQRILDAVGAKSGQTLLVSGAAGGVGSAVVQLARRRGLVVIGTASEPKHAYLRGLGAIPTSYGPGLVERVKALAPNGVDAAFDIVGSGVIPELVALTGNPAKVVTIILSQSKQGTQSSFGASPHAKEALAEAARAFEDGQLRMHVEQTFRLDQAGDAQKLSAEGRVTGKLVLIVS